jgi:hypothetical protein
MSRRRPRPVQVSRTAFLFLLTAMATTAVFTRSARAEDEPCGPAERAWAAACSTADGGRVEAFRCPAGHVVFSVADHGGSPVFVDAVRGGAALRQIHGIGLSPLGEFDDFRTAPEPVRDAFERIAACVERDPSLGLSGSSSRTPATALRPGSPPWRLLAGLALAGIALTSPRRPRRSTVGILAALLALGAATFGLARVVVGASFFHQNGHGPNWIGYALGEPCSYGPGFEELFGWAARLRPGSPEGPVFICNGVLAATWPVAAWIVSRRVGARAVLAWAIAVAVAIDPLLLRIAFTESYYVAITALVLVATAVALSAPTLRAGAPRFVLAHVAAGLIAAQAARVHPVGWVAVALVGLGHLARPGAATRNLRRAAVATATIGAVVGVAAGPAILDVLAGEMGAHYLPELRRGSPREYRWMAAIAAAALVTLATTPLWRRRLPARLALVALVLVAATAGTALLAIDVDWIKAAHARIFLAPAMAAVVGLLAGVLRRRELGRAAAVAAVGLGLGNAVVHWRWVTDLPTDALELRLALRWRDDIARGTKLVAVETSGIMVLELPLYGDARSRVVALDTREPPSRLGFLGDRVFYYRSSLCSTGQAHGWCDSLERTAELEPVDVHELPARPSTHAVTYEGERVRVGLYRVTPRVRPDQLQ